jgi:hypothetical protein
VKPMDANEEYVAEILKARAAGAIVGANADPKGTKTKRTRHLKPAWQPGQSGNPSGKAPGTVSLRRILRARLAEIPEGSDRRTMAEQLVDSTCKAALKGDAQARKLIWESIEGAARQQIDVTAHEYTPPVIDEDTMIAYALEAAAICEEADRRAAREAAND